MHTSVMQFLKTDISYGEINGRTVLEVGAQDVNGSPRTVLLPHKPEKYVGIDFAKGTGVDLVLDVKNLVQHFGANHFDVVISTEMLEHAQDWRAAVAQMKGVLKVGGLLVITTRGPGFPYHGYPHDYWRFTVPDFEKIFSDMSVEVCCRDRDLGAPGVFLKARKSGEATVDLSTIVVTPIVR